MKYKRIEHVAIAVKNLDAVRDTLAGIGIACDHEETLPGPGVRLAMLPIGESALELLEPQNDTGRTAEWIRERGEGLFHICLEVEDIEASLDELRARIGRGYSDEEFLLRAVMPADQVDAMKAAGPARRGYDPATRPVMALMQELTARKGLTSIRIEKPGLKLELNGGR